MRRFIYIIAILTVMPIGKIMAQQGFSFGVGGGPNFFYGSMTKEDNIGYTGQFDVRYGFNSNISSTLSYSFNKLQAARNTTDGIREKYFETSANNIDLHIGFDVLQISQIVSQDFPLKVILDLGLGYSFYDESLFYGESHGDAVAGTLNYAYKQGEHGPGAAAKTHFGAEFSYDVGPSVAIFASILGNYYFTSGVDGYEHYANNPDKVALNDFYYSTLIGLRYTLEPSTGLSPRKSQYGRYVNNRHGSLFQNFRFNRYTGRKSPRDSYYKNRSKQARQYPGGRYQGKKKGGGIPW